MIALLLAAVIGLGPKTHDVDLVEFNHARLEDGQVIDQLIFYDWLPDYRRFELVAIGRLDYGCECCSNDITWVMVRGDQQPPSRRADGRWYTKIGREVIRARLFKETWTAHDREVEARKLAGQLRNLGVELE